MDWLINLFLHRGNDISTHFLPNAYFFKRSILDFHQIPLWSTFQFLGQSYLADPQNYIFYLPNYLFVLLPIEPAFLILIFSHLLFAGIGAYFLAKNYFNLTKLPSIFVALAFALTPKIFAHLEGGHYSMILAFSWLPWFIHAAFKFVAKPSVKLACCLSLTAWLLYINYINIAYYSILFFYTLTLFTLITRRLPVRGFLIHNSLFLILFLGLISPNLFAQLEFASLSTRQQMIFEYIAQPIWSFKLFLQNLLFPYKLTYLQFTTERILFPGIVIGTLSVLGFFHSRHKSRWFFAGWIIFSLLYSLGARIPFFIFFYKYFPLIKWMRITTRLWIISNLLIAMFAGIGLEQLRRKFTPKLTYLIIVLALVELFGIHYKIFNQPTQANLLPQSFYRYLQQEPNNNFRTYCTSGCFSLQKLGEINVNSITGNNPVQLISFINYLQTSAGYQYWHYAPILPPYQTLDQKPQPNAQLMGSLNVKYVASPYPLTDKNFEILETTHDFYLYLNSAQQSAWLTNDGTAKIVAYSPNKITVSVSSHANNTLALSEMFYPGWRAVDQNNSPLPIIDAQPFRAVPINSSVQQVTFSYWPRSLTITLPIFFTSLLFIIYAYYHPQLFYRFSRARRRSPRRRIK